MKRFHYLLPILVIALGLAWHLRRADQITTLQEKIISLETRVIASSTSPPATTRVSPLMFDINGPPKPGDWARIARALSERDVESWRMAFIDQSLLLSESELITGLDEIETLILHPNVRDALRSTLLLRLTPMNPEAALVRCDLSTTYQAGRTRNAFQGWLEKDPGAALAWYEQKRAEGALGSKSIGKENPTSSLLEAAVLDHLFKHDPSTAIERFAELPPDLRDQAISRIDLRTLDQGDQIKWVRFLRSNLPTEERPAAIASLGTTIAAPDAKNRFQSLDEFLTSIEATPGERQATIDSIATLNSAMGNVDPADYVGALRAWAANQLPGSEDAATAKILLVFAGHQRFTYDHTLTEIERYVEQGGGDDLIATYFAKPKPGLTAEQSARTRELISRIQDETRRSQILNRLPK